MDKCPPNAFAESSDSAKAHPRRFLLKPRSKTACPPVPLSTNGLLPSLYFAPKRASSRQFAQISSQFCPYPLPRSHETANQASSLHVEDSCEYDLIGSQSLLLCYIRDFCEPFRLFCPEIILHENRPACAENRDSIPAHRNLVNPPRNMRYCMKSDIRPTLMVGG